jgi:hypothetical protein
LETSWRKTILQAFLQVTTSRSQVVLRHNTDTVHDLECSHHKTKFKTMFLLSHPGLELSSEIQHVAMFITVNVNLVDLEGQLD